MTRWTRGLFGSKAYDFRRLIDHRTRQFVSEATGPTLQMVCDIDKTYLETNFASLLQIVRIAFEEAHEKVTVTGARDVLLAARWGVGANPPSGETYPRPLHFVSSSPPQLRSVLEEKLASDGLDWTSDTFKNQAYNLRKRRIDQLRQHTAYKSAAIMRILSEAEPNSQFVLVGDNAEHDAYIYLGIKLFLEKRITLSGYQKYLIASGVEKQVAADFAKFLEVVPTVSIRSILIRQAPGYSFHSIEPLTTPIDLFHDYFEAALLLIRDGFIDPSALRDLIRRFHNHHGKSREELFNAMKAMQKLPISESFAEAIQEAVTWLDAISFLQESETTLLSPPSDAFKSLTEDEILALAESWAARIHGKEEYSK